MSRTLTALVLTPGVTYCSSITGNPYRADTSGIVHVEAQDVAEITAKSGGHAANPTEVGATHYRGAPLTITVA